MMCLKRFPRYFNIQTNPDLKSFETRKGFKNDRILTFIPTKQEDLSESQRKRFITKLKHVLRSIVFEGSNSKFELFSTYFDIQTHPDFNHLRLEKDLSTIKYQPLFQLGVKIKARAKEKLPNKVVEACTEEHCI